MALNVKSVLLNPLLNTGYWSMVMLQRLALYWVAPPVAWCAIYLIFLLSAFLLIVCSVYLPSALFESTILFAVVYLTSTWAGPNESLSSSVNRPVLTCLIWLCRVYSTLCVFSFLTQMQILCTFLLTFYMNKVCFKFKADPYCAFKLHTNPGPPPCNRGWRSLAC